VVEPITQAKAPATSTPIEARVPATKPTLADVRKSWPVPRPLRRVADERQSEFDFTNASPEATVSGPANDPAGQSDLLDLLHGGR
jgi:hypothetical protein